MRFPFFFVGFICHRKRFINKPFSAISPFLFGYSRDFMYFCFLTSLSMKTKKEYIDILKLHVAELKNQFGIRSFRLFGSVARDEQQDDSDVDVCVEMDPDLYQLVGLKQFLEKLLGCSVDVIRIHRNMNKLLMKQNEKDGIYVF